MRKYSITIWTKDDQMWGDVMSFKKESNAKNVYDFLVNQIAIDNEENIKEIVLKNTFGYPIESTSF